MHVEQVLASAKDVLSSWRLAKKPLQTCSLVQSVVQQEATVRWNAPSFGYLKCNIDAGFFLCSRIDRVWDICE